MNTKNFEVGDLVRIKEDLELNKLYNGWNFNSEMYLNRGKTFRIKAKNPDRYILTDDDSVFSYVWGWTDEMLEPALQESPVCDKSDFNHDTLDISVSLDDLMKLYSR